MSPVPPIRVRALNDAPVNPAAGYVLYWMVAHRRLAWNFALQRAVWWAGELGRPLLVFEPLRSDYPWASDRLHRFVLDGMADHRDAAAGRAGLRYVAWIETTRRQGRGLLAALAADAGVVVTDDFPAFFIPKMIEAAGAGLPVRCEAVDANGLLPIRQPGREFATAYAFRRYLQQSLPAHLADPPAADPLAALPQVPAPPMPAALSGQWHSPARELIDGTISLSTLPIDHGVGLVEQRGGARAAVRALAAFLEGPLADYGGGRNRAEVDVTSRLSPYLHFGHIASWEVVTTVLARDGWLGRTSPRATGAREGWWGASPPVEAFLDQIVTWRELGFTSCVARPADYDRYESLPDWARATLGKHQSDPRAYRYELDHFAAGRTHDPLWNAAQGQLLAEGRIHNYLRMLWGKKVLEWTATPHEALAVLIELNNRYALDGRDPNSYSGIFWTLGRYDRPWAPERPIFGTVRYMSSENTARKMPVRSYVRRYAPADGTADAQPALLDLT
jgi:deoxyribodipyrimidine photo-lyase